MSCFVNGIKTLINGLHLLGDLILCGVARITSCANHDIQIVPGGTGITIIGDASAPVDIGAVNDNFFVSGEAEFAGNVFLQGEVRSNANQFFANNLSLVFGSPTAFILEYDSISDQMLFSLDSTIGNQIVVVNVAFRTRNFDHLNQPNPTQYIHSETDPDIDNTQWLSSAHNQTDKVSGIGKGGHVTNHEAPVDLADDGSFDLPDATAGFGFIIAGDGEEYVQFSWTSAAVVTLINNSANVVNTDTDTNLCVFDNGTTVRVRNRLGAAKKIMFDYHYTTP